MGKAENLRSERCADADLLRIIACFFVVMLHSCGAGSPAAVIMNSITRFSVPVFVMISGRFCLRSDNNPGHYLKKCGRLMLTFLLWSAVYMLLDGDFCGNAGFWGAAGALLTGPQHFWYIYAAMALYLSAPILQAFCRNADKRLTGYFLLLTFLLGSVVNTLLAAGSAPLLKTIMAEMKAEKMLGFLCLFVFGYYCDRFGLEKRQRTALYILGGAGLVCTAAGTLLMPLDTGGYDVLLFGFFTPNVLLYSAAVYVAVTELYKKHPAGERARRFISGLAECSFGVYLLHVLVLRDVVEAAGFWAALPVWISILLRSAAAFCLTAAAVYLLRKIKFMRAVT
jgi:surface polysaccharide O-acyltransferase-like enzyme